jgi:uncharacterized protein (TIGR00725 family)
VTLGPRPRSSPYIAVIGPGDAEEEIYALAVEAGRLIAERNGVVVCGGLGGVMEAAARWASERGGRSLGLLPGTDRAQANPYLTLVVATGLGELRNGVLIATSDAVLAIGGSWGTLSEMALARRKGLPLVTLRGWSVTDGAGISVGGNAVTETPTEAVAALWENFDNP